MSLEQFICSVDSLFKIDSVTINDNMIKEYVEEHEYSPIKQLNTWVNNTYLHKYMLGMHSKKCKHTENTCLSFNCITVVLTKSDLVRLKNKMNVTQQDVDTTFINEALAELKARKDDVIFYYGRW